MFNSSELSTAVQYGINLVTVVFRNDSYGNVARDLDDAFGGAYGTDLHNPGLRQVRRGVRRRRHEGKRPDRARDAHTAGAGASGSGDHRRALRRDADTPRPAVRAVLQPALDHAPRGPDTVLMRR